jgi:hypothetical protein
LAAAALNGSENQPEEIDSAEEPMHIATLELELFRSSGTLFDLEMKGIIRKPFSKVLR